MLSFQTRICIGRKATAEACFYAKEDALRAHGPAFGCEPSFPSSILLPVFGAEQRQMAAQVAGQQGVVFLPPGAPQPEGAASEG